MSPVSTLNLSGPAPTSLSSGPFKLRAPSGSDTWRTPPATDRFTSPVAYVPIQLSSFRRMRVTATAAYSAMYDQAGLTVIFPPAEGAADQRPHWLKAGLEVVDGVRHASVVRAEPYSDWSMTPLRDGDERHAAATRQPRGGITVEFERDVKEGGKLSTALWVYVVTADGARQKLRECTAFFDKPDDTVAWVGVYLARPIGPESKEDFEVEFTDFQLETA